MYLFFDTETTGLPRDWKAPISNLDNWPRLVQLAWSRYDSVGNQIYKKDYIIKPEDFEIPKFSSIIHRISNERANQEGVGLRGVLEEFAQDIQKSKVLVAHNMEFDTKVMGAEFLRKEVDNNLFDIPQVCTMRGSVDFCKIEGGPRGYKWPTLSELHKKLFGDDFAGAHDASADIDACAKCFFTLRKKHIINSREIEQKEEEYLKERNIKLI